MNEQELRNNALLDSIKHWQENFAAQTPDQAELGPGACALCDAFRNDTVDTENCTNCPVKEKTGYDLCDGSPYHEAWLAWEQWSENNTTASPEEAEQLKTAWQAAAQKEIDFLISLL
jgi:hypothetical protein